MFEMLTDNGRTKDAFLYYKLTYEPNGSGELVSDNLSKRKINFNGKLYRTCFLKAYFHREVKRCKGFIQHLQGTSLCPDTSNMTYCKF